MPKRYPVHKVVSYTHGQKQLLTLTVDLALGGMKIKTHEKLPKNERLNFNMVLGTKSISPEERVVYSKSLPGKQRVSGIQFLGFPGVTPRYYAGIFLLWRKSQN
jgi:hypothetical protein